jgi:hypothetical protein
LSWRTKQSQSHDDDAVRTIVDLPEEQIKALDAYRKRHGISRAEAVRRAVAAFIPPKSHKKKKAVAIVSPVPTKGTKRPLGLLAGKAHIAVADDWEIDESQFLGT